MNVDHRGRCRFGHKGFRAEVGKSGSVNIASRDRNFGEESVGSLVYKDLMGDPEFISKLFWANAAVRLAEKQASFSQAVS